MYCQNKKVEKMKIDVRGEEAHSLPKIMMKGGD